MHSLKGKFTRIEGSFSQVRRMPRLGKIRLGVKVEKLGRNGSTQYPKETEYFVCPPEVQAIYGEKPTELDVMLPLDDPEIVFQQKLALYGSGAGLKCQGNGRIAERYNEQTKQWEERTCPCEFLRTETNPKGACTEQSHLMVLLPKVSLGGCYQITTRSFHSTVALNSALDYIRGLAGRIALLPLKLRRVPQETHHDGKKQIHYVMNLVLDANLQEIADLRANPAALLIPSQYQIEGPVDENPAVDPPDVQEVDAAEVAEMEEDEIDQLQAQLDAKLKGTGNGTKPSQEKAPAQTVPPSETPSTPGSAGPPPASGSPKHKGRPQPPNESEWLDWQSHFGSSGDLIALANDVKKIMKVETLNLTPAGRVKFLEIARIEGSKRGITVEG
jgi:hypothetical protein